MGAIDDIYEDLDADVSEERFREAVEDKVEQMGGLADEETAAMLIAHELDESEVNAVADIEAGMQEVKFIAKVISIGDLRTFERDGEDEEDGCVINVDVADETGTVRLAFWDGQAQAIDDGQMEPGDVLRIKGRPKDGYSGLEVSVDEAQPDEETEIEVELGDGSTIDALTLGQSDVTVDGRVLSTDSVRTFDRDDGSEGKVANLTIGDETGRVRVTLWDEKADLAESIEPNTCVEIVDGYVRERDGSLELHLGEEGAVNEIDAEIHFEPEADLIADVEIDDTADLAGVVRSTDPIRTFDRDDGSEGQVRNVRIQDESGDLRVALWGDKADLDVAPGDHLYVADVEIQDGWQDDKEASANWASTVVPLPDDALDAPTGGTAGGGGASGAGADSADGGLAAYTDDANTDEESSGDDRGAAEAAAVSGGPDGTEGGESTSETDDSTGANAVADGDEVEFTGTVVQTGDPVVLDDGEQTMSVETSEAVTLGQQVTARGQIHDGRLDADDLF